MLVTILSIVALVAIGLVVIRVTRRVLRSRRSTRIEQRRVDRQALSNILVDRADDTD